MRAQMKAIWAALLTALLLGVTLSSARADFAGVGGTSVVTGGSGGTGFDQTTPYTANGNGANKSTSLADRNGHLFNMLDDFTGGWGDTLDGFVDGIIAPGSKQLCSASSSFTSADIGKYMVVDGVGPAAAPLLTSIVAIVSSTCVTLNDAATFAGPSWYQTLTSSPIDQQTGVTRNYAPGANLTAVGGTFVRPVQSQVQYTAVGAATVASPGSGAGAALTSCIVNGTTGTQLGKQQLSVKLSLSNGSATGVISIATAGWFTSNPASAPGGSDPATTAEPVTGCSLTGVTLHLTMVPRTLAIMDGGQYSTKPSNPYSVTSSDGGVGAAIKGTFQQTQFYYGHEDTSAYASALTLSDTLGAQGKRACIYFPAAIYSIRLGAIPINKRNLCVYGDGVGHTTIRILPNAAGDLFPCSNCWGSALGAFVNNAQTGSARLDAGNTSLHDFTVIGDNGSTAHQNMAMFYDFTDHIEVYNIEGDYIHGKGIGTGVPLNSATSTLRESRLRNLRFRYVGDGAAYPVIDLMSTGAVDGINTNQIGTIREFANNGTGFRLCNNSTNNSGRAMNIDDLIIEGEQRGFIPVDHLLVGDPACTGQLGNIAFTGLALLSSYAGQAAARVGCHDQSNTPSYISFRGPGSIGGSSYGPGFEIDCGSYITVAVDNIVSNNTDFVVGPSSNVAGPVYVQTPNFPTWTTNIDPTSIPNVLGYIPTAIFAPPAAAVGGAAVALAGQSGTINTLSGTVAQTELGHCDYKASAPLGPNGRIEITTNWNYTSSNNPKTLQVQFGGANFFSSTVTASSYLPLMTTIQNKAATNAQTGTPANQTSSFQTTGGATYTAAIDTTVDQRISILGTLSQAASDAGEALSLNSVICKEFPAS